MITEDNSGHANGQQTDQEAQKSNAEKRMTYLFLIRHGENDWVDTGKLAGRTPGVYLNQKGREQSQALAAQLSQQPISAIYSSPLERCVETAEPLANTLGLSVIEEPGVLEVDYGEWRGGALKELAKKPEWQLVQIYPGGFRFPGGETLREVQSRVIRTLERIRTDHAGEAVAVFAHGDVIRTSLAYYLGTALDMFQRIQISTASVSVIGFHRFGPRILGMNYVGDIPKIRWEAPKQKESEAKS